MTIHDHDPGDESEAAMTDEREKKPLEAKAWALIVESVDGETAKLEEMAPHREWLEPKIRHYGIFARILPCRVIVEDEP